MLRHLLLGCLALVALPACKRDSTVIDDALPAAQAMDAVELSLLEASLVVASTNGLDPDVTGDQAATAAAQATTKVFGPASCVSVVVKGTAVSYTLANCTGPFHAGRITGKLDVVFSVGADGLHAQASATELHIGGATIDIASEGLYTKSGTESRLDVDTHGAGTGSRGNRLQRDGAYTFTWDGIGGCAGLDGDIQTRVGLKTWSTTITSLRRCAGGCPEAGGSIVHDARPLGARVTITFDGTGTAAWQSSRGGRGSIDLACADGA